MNAESTPQIKVRKYEGIEYAPTMIIKKIVWYGILLLIAIAFLTPIVFMFLGAFKTTQELSRVPFNWLPDRIALDNFKSVFAKIPFFLYLKNTMLIAVFNITGSIVSNTLVAYGFSRINWPGRNKVFVLVIVTMILPFQITMVPLAKPALATVAVFAFIRSWNDYIGPLLFLQDPKLYTLSLAASMLKSRLDPQWTVLLALGSMLVLPVLILFFVLQKYFIQGVTMSGIKG